MNTSFFLVNDSYKVTEKSYGKKSKQDFFVAA